MFDRISVVATACLLLSMAPLGAAQGTSACPPAWIPTFGSTPGVDGPVNAAAWFARGGAPELVVAGEFANAGGAPALRIARWDGTAWSALGSGIGAGFPDAVRALAVFDSGNGPELIAAGTFVSAGGVPAANIARWNGQSWNSLGAGIGGAVHALEVFPSPNGLRLIAAGSFTSAGGAPAAAIAAWDGAAWSPVGAGITAGTCQFCTPVVRALESYELVPGAGEVLFAAGEFGAAGGVPAGSIARWDGNVWSAVGSGMDFGVLALAGHDDGSGPALWASGFFSSAGGQGAGGLARFDGSGWTGVGSGFQGAQALLSASDSAGPALFVGGLFPFPNGMGSNNVVRWDGQSFATLDGGVNGTVRALAADPTGPGVWAVGTFPSAGSVPANRVAKWDGAQWSAAGLGLPAGVSKLVRFDDGSGPALFVGGAFEGVGGIPARGLARWKDGTWSAVPGSPPADVLDLEVMWDEGAPALFVSTIEPADGKPSVAGSLQRLRAGVWTTIVPVVPGLIVHDLHAFDDGSGLHLFLGGEFQIGSSFNVAKWRAGVFSPLAFGLPFNGSLQSVRTLAGVDFGDGPALYAGGRFDSTGTLGAPIADLARWRAGVWEPAPGWQDGEVDALCAHVEGGGLRLIAGGPFTTAGGAPASAIAAFNGSVWSAYGGGAFGPSPRVNALDSVLLPAGAGQALVASGPGIAGFGGVTTGPLGLRAGGVWWSLGNGLVGTAATALVHDGDDAGGPALYVGGSFTVAGGGDNHLARWDCAFANFDARPNCTGTAVHLSALVPQLQPGAAAGFELSGAPVGAGLALLYAGAPWPPTPCGLALPGLGELWLAPTPAPALLLTLPTSTGGAVFGFAVPNLPGLVGVEFGLQAVHAALSLPGVPIAFSSALATTVAP